MKKFFAKLSVNAVILFAAGITRAQEFENITFTNRTFIAASFINDSEGWLADNNSKLWHTVNAAQTWDSVTVSKNFVLLQFISSTNGFALTSNAAYKTSNGGQSWSELSMPQNVRAKAIYFLDANTGYLGSYGNIFKTADGGASWSSAEIEGVNILDFYFTGSSSGIAVGYDDGENRCIWRTTDNGATWENVFNEENHYLNAVYFVNETTGWAAGYYDRAGMKEPIILKTTDSGATWQKNYRYTGISSDGETLTDIRFKNELEGYALSVHNYDLFTKDGGETWRLVNDTDELNATPVFGLYKTLSGLNELYLVGQKGTVSRWE
ncbi:MAG: hypothetical protein K1X63_05615 [Chitinophagales bacterium]|nr:hypothetical protein [Bacteroidota bacterium]MBX7140542.1 hypothetical protein [Chitinophagales bacterium]